MTDHAASEPTPRTEASEQTDMGPLNEAELSIINRAKDRSAQLMDGVTAELCIYYRRELSDMTRKLAEAEKKRREDVRRCEFVCNIQRDYDLDRTGKSWYEGILDACEAIRDTFPEVFK